MCGNCWEYVHEDRLFAALKWAVKRMDCSTTYLSLAVDSPQDMPDHQAFSSMLPGTPHLEGLRCIELLGSICINDDDSAVFEPFTDCLQLFIDWLLQHAANLEALSVCTSTFALAEGPQLFERLRHLTIPPDILEGGVFHPARQLPVLETLCVNGNLRESIDFPECKRLRLLVVKGTVKLHLVKHPACRLVVEMQDGWLSFSALGWLQHKGLDLGLIDQLLATNEEFLKDFKIKGIFAALHRMEILNVSWPAFSDARNDGAVRYNDIPAHKPLGLDESEDTLIRCMPENGMPVCNLQVLIIKGKGNIKVLIPGALPNLRELVVYAKGRLELSFEQPAAMCRALQTFYALGQPLFPSLSDVHQSLAQRSMVLGEVFAQHADGGERLSSDASCVHLKPRGAPDVSMRELFTTVEALANKCRCGACFACLREAGCLEFGRD